MRDVVWRRGGDQLRLTTALLSLTLTANLSFVMDKDKYWTDFEDTGHYILIPPTSTLRHQDLVIRNESIASKQRFDNSEIA